MDSFKGIVGGFVFSCSRMFWGAININNIMPMLGTAPASKNNLV